jgi:hypothetical protein
MTAPRLEVADVLRRYTPAFLEAFGDTVCAAQRRVLHDLVRCRTAALGGHVEACDACNHQRVAYNSCRNRHCPKCQGASRARWLEERAAELLPTEYFHVVFTLPDTLGLIALQNQRLVYGTVFRTAAETLMQLAADPQHLGADIGFLAVLHTWGQNLHLHPHVHCVVPGGGLAPEGDRWLACRAGFFLPVRVLSRLFRGKFLAALQQAFAGGRLGFHGQQAGLANATAFRRWIAGLRAKEWVVYAKPPLGSGPEQVLKYLARYTHRVAISNQRLVAMEGGKVAFQWKDYADGNKPKTMELDAVEFIRRFLLHVLPAGFVRIRHYGFLGNRHRKEKLELCRRLLGVPPPTAEAPAASAAKPAAGSAASCRDRCPACGHGRMIVIGELRPEPVARQGAEPADAERGWNTS